MIKSVSNVLTNWKLKELTNIGIDTAAILEKSDISRYELTKSNGRISAAAHNQFQLKTMEYNQFIYNNISSDLFFDLFPDLFGLCLNESSAINAIDAFIKFRFIMGDCDDCFAKQKDNQIKIEYHRINSIHSNIGHEKLNNNSVGHFILLKELLSHYLPSGSIEIGFDSSYPLSRKVINDRFQTNCLFEQNSNFLIITSPQLTAKNEIFNAKLNALQKARLETSRSNLPAVNHFSMLVAEIIESAISQDNYGNENTLLDNVCFNLKISRWTLNNKLQLEKTSFTDLLKQVKFKKARDLLLETDKSVKEISELTSFSSQAVFSRFFNSQANISPLQYRKKFSRNNV